LLVVLMVFFFQAEDGIRDATVTGVQTCALPIFIVDRVNVNGMTTGEIMPFTLTRSTMTHSLIGWILIGLIAGWLTGKITRGTGRSEERRVGKEWRSRWAPWRRKRTQNVLRRKFD